jgi:hypothetical protein
LESAVASTSGTTIVWVNSVAIVGTGSEIGSSSLWFETCAVSTEAALDNDSDTEVMFSRAIVIVSGGE